MVRVLLLLAGLAAVCADSEASPIFQPGAPGEPSREIAADDALALSRSSFVPADVVFMQHMIVHHAQAVEMVALLETRGAHDGVRRLGERIASNQATEMDMMRTWLEQRGQAADDPHLSHGHHGGAHSGHDPHAGHTAHQSHASHQQHHGAHGSHGSAGAHAHHGHHTPAPAAPGPGDTPLMPGMLSPNQMAALAAADGAEFDRLFLEGMIVHHQGALDMVNDLVRLPGSAQDPQLSDFLSHVVSDQSAEILRMQSLLSDV
ncbi:DUF305 domain-containing protein [Hyphomonadaceae bacterium BL14]|nr:DUF305 domain-containing protein [Hyphomonadaceae bacterium BL14]